MKKVEEISTLRGQMMKDNIQAILEAKSVLTPEQQKKVREYMESWFSRGGWSAHWREHHRRDPMWDPTALETCRHGPRNHPQTDRQSVSVLTSPPTEWCLKEKLR